MNQKGVFKTCPFNLEDFFEEKLVNTITKNQKTVKIPLHDARKNLVMKFRISRKESKLILRLLATKGAIERNNSSISISNRSGKDLICVSSVNK